MKKNRRTWFTITAAPDAAGGRHVRYYSVECRCGRRASHQASDLKDDGLRRYFTRLGWTIGKTPTQHHCPGCLHDKPVPRPAAPPAPAPSVIVTPPPTLSLEAAWEAASDEQRADFMLKHFGLDPAAEVAPAPPEPIPAESVDDEEPADWWQRLQQERAA